MTRDAVTRSAVTPDAVPRDLVRGVRLLCLDAGNTVIFLDHARVARWLATRGIGVTAETLVRCEGEAKVLAEQRAMVDVAWEGRHAPGALGWGAMIGTMIHRAGVDPAKLVELLPRLWDEHVVLNLYSAVPVGLGAALDAVRARGVKVAIVSNSEGMLDELFAELRIASHFDAVIDSGRYGIEKPDPRIFGAALERFNAKPEQAFHLGDTFATDVLGARAAGIRTALIDPHGHYEGRHPDVPRVAGVVAVAEAMLEGG